MSGTRHTFFIAHAGRDTAQAEALYDALRGAGVSCFLDSRDLLPGDQWDRKLGQAQRGALATVVLVSKAVDSAYYLREEIASAIAFQRADEDRHRLVPVYLDGIPRTPDETPYGLRILHGLDVVKLGLPGVVEQLSRVAAALNGDPRAATVAAPPLEANSEEARTLLTALGRLLPSQFEVVLFHSGVPREHVASESAAPARRALDVVQLAQQAGPAGLTRLREAIQREAPGLLG